MLAHAASSSALPWSLVSRPVSRQSRLETHVFPGKTGGFAAEVVGFELVGDVLKRGDGGNGPDQTFSDLKIALSLGVRYHLALRSSISIDRLHWCGLPSSGSSV